MWSELPTKLAPKDIEKTDMPYLISLQFSNQCQEPKYKIGQQVRVKRKIETFLRGYRSQFTEEVFTNTAIQTLNPPTYIIKDANNQLIQGKFCESELILFKNGFQVFLTDNPSKTMSLREFTINLMSNISMETFLEHTLLYFSTLIPQQLNVTGSWEVALAGIAWPAAMQIITSANFK